MRVLSPTEYATYELPEIRRHLIAAHGIDFDTPRSRSQLVMAHAADHLASPDGLSPNHSHDLEEAPTSLEARILDVLDTFVDPDEVDALAGAAIARITRPTVPTTGETE